MHLVAGCIYTPAHEGPRIRDRGSISHPYDNATRSNVFLASYDFRGERIGIPTASVNMQQYMGCTYKVVSGLAICGARIGATPISLHLRVAADRHRA